MQRSFTELCKLAYKGIAANQEYDDEVQLIFKESELPDDFDNLGFMDSVTEHSVTEQPLVIVEILLSTLLRTLSRVVPTYNEQLFAPYILSMHFSTFKEGTQLLNKGQNAVSPMCRRFHYQKFHYTGKDVLYENYRAQKVLLGLLN